MKNYRVKLSQPELKGNELAYVQDAIAKKEIGPRGFYIDAFETEVASYIGVKHSLAVSSGTAAIQLGLQVLGVSKGDLVLCSTFTFAASAFPIKYLGAEPVFVDSEIDSWNMCPDLLEEAVLEEIKLGKKPKAIVVVHAYGMPAEMTRIVEISKKYAIPLLEDAAAALGSSYKGRKCGSFGDVAVFSFNANKIISTGGGGALVSNTKSYIEKANYLATQAKENCDYYLHNEIGYNYKMSNITAAIGLAQLENIDQKITSRRGVFSKYESLLSIEKSVVFQEEQESFFSNRWLSCMVLNSNRDVSKIRAGAIGQGIELGRLWNPLHCQPVFADSKKYLNGTSEKLFKKGVSLPSSSELEISIQQMISKIIIDNTPND